MPDRHRAKPRKWRHLLAGMCLAGAGCQALTGAPNPTAGPVTTFRSAQPDHETAAVTLGPRSAVFWSIESAKDQPGQVMTGKSLVGPDGTMELGPYGVVRVEGLTLPQAQDAVEKQAAKYLGQPTVRLHLPGTDLRAVSATTSVATEKTSSETAAKPPVAPPVWDTEKPAVAPSATTPQPKDAEGGAGSGLASDWHPIRRNVVRSTSGKQSDSPSEQLHPPRKLPRSTDEPPLAGSSTLYPGCSRVSAGGAPHELSKVSLPTYVIEPPDILLVEYPAGSMDEGKKQLYQPIRGQHLVRPDGTIGLGYYGSVYVAGMTLDQARLVIAEHVRTTRRSDFDARDLTVDVLAYNSKFYYIITDGGGYGEQVIRVPITGSETVLDAISQINGLPAVASKKHIWIARRTGADGGQMLPVDWNALVQGGSTTTNYQIFPGDRLYVRADKWVRFGNGVDKRIWPFERMLGAVLLGSETVNSIQGRGAFGGSTGR